MLTPLLAIFLFAVIFILSGFRIVRPIEKGLIERFGRYSHTATQGLNWIIPVVDKMIKVNIAETQIDLVKQSVITKDNLNLDIDGVVYFKVQDTLKATYNINHYPWAVSSLAQTTLRSVIGEMEFVVVNAKRQTINARIEEELDQQTKSWGIDVLRVELQDIQPSRDVQIAMDKVVTAERNKEAKITTAKADKEAAREMAEATVLQADADRRSRIERAKGFAEEIRLHAIAKAESIERVNISVEKTFRSNAQKYKAFEVTEKSLQGNAKFILTEKGISPTIVLNESSDKVIPFKSKNV